MLSDRRQKVLAALIEEYVAHALPVGSRTLTERYRLGVSPATVRNELSYLEEGGYIVQPHTSAGRIPTDYGYRAFVDGILEGDSLGNEPSYQDVVDELRRNATELDNLLERTSIALTRLTDCLSVVLAPTVLRLRVRQISLISLSPYRAIAVVVTDNGEVFNRALDFSTEVETDELARVQRVLSEILCGKTLQEIQDGLERVMYEALRDPLLRVVLDEILACLQENRVGRTRRLGMSSLLAQPEFKHASAVLPIIQVLENDTVLFHVLDESAEASGGLSVRIGSENKAAELSGVSVVASRYGRGDTMGVVAVIGPTRMDYSKVIQAVRAASTALDDI